MSMDGLMLAGVGFLFSLLGALMARRAWRWQGEVPLRWQHRVAQHAAALPIALSAFSFGILGLVLAAVGPGEGSPVEKVVAGVFAVVPMVFAGLAITVARYGRPRRLTPPVLRRPPEQFGKEPRR
ncbi:hypothetical protein [Patulibacter medicamentivorans]|uniref:hypothetical protein n=1 Tax=Patulibacter medicamentivorans TaxID=1097667 RepID=UPI00058F457E|nr:hypothetical protein [Patulibacter medicamentivorans]